MLSNCHGRTHPGAAKKITQGRKNTAPCALFPNAVYYNESDDPDKNTNLRNISRSGLTTATKSPNAEYALRGENGCRTVLTAIRGRARYKARCRPGHERRRQSDARERSVGEDVMLSERRYRRHHHAGKSRCGRGLKWLSWRFPCRILQSARPQVALVASSVAEFSHP